MPAVDLADLDRYVSRFEPWATSDDVQCDSIVESAPEALDRALLDATWLLHHATGRQYGIEEVTLRPSRQPTEDDLPDHPWYTVPQVPYSPRGCPYGCAGLRCGCQSANRVMLQGRIRTVEQVVLDGEVLDPSTYYLSSDHRWLYRATGHGYWPLCPNQYLPLDDPGTFGVTVTRGKPVPPPGVTAVAALACELALPDGECRVTTKASDLLALLREGATGILAVDLFVKMANPGRISRRATVTGVEDLS